MWGNDLVNTQEGLTHHRWRTPSPDKVSSPSQSPQTASLQEEKERISAQETGGGNTTAAHSRYSCFFSFGSDLNPVNFQLGWQLHLSHFDYEILLIHLSDPTIRKWSSICLEFHRVP